ncbi:MAG: hypothetical protein KDC05_02775 [Bacteroidales bacterium]|nr:hypothetical protein [Bacteroidales bacterium]
MKKSVFLSVMIFFNAILFAQDGSDYMNIMVKQKNAFRMTHTVDGFQSLANDYERIANAEIDKWQPLYYAALCYLNMSFITDDLDKVDGYLDSAQPFIDRALEIYPDESELHVLQGMLYQARIKVDAAGRGMQYSMKATEELNKAKEYNRDNPRVYYLLGMNVLHTPESFGGGAEAACPYFKKADQLFKSYVPENVLSPTWGPERNQQLLSSNCQGN